MRIQLHKRVFLNFVLVIALFGILGAVLSAILINRTLLNEAQRRARFTLQPRGARGGEETVRI